MFSEKVALMLAVGATSVALALGEVLVTLGGVVSGSVDSCASSKAPESQASPCGRPTPRWSVVGGGQAPCPTKSTAGLFGWSPMVRVGPPLSFNPAGSRRGLVFEREPVSWVKPQVSPSSML